MAEDRPADDVLNPSTGDLGIAVAKGIVGSVPIIGALGAEVLALAITPPLQRRMASWMDSVSARLVELEKTVKGFKIADLGNNPSFVTTMLQATQDAMRTHQEEKLEALRNAVVNSALPNALDDTKRLIFLNIVDSATPLHLLLLRYLDNPVDAFLKSKKRLPNVSAGSHFSQLVKLYPDLRTQQPLVDIVVRDLHDWGLIVPETLHGIITLSGLEAPNRTPLGKEFLRFISPPQTQP